MQTAFMRAAPPAGIEDFSSYHSDGTPRGENRPLKSRCKMQSPRPIMHCAPRTSLLHVPPLSSSHASSACRMLSVLICFISLSLFGAPVLSQDSDEGHGPPTLAIGAAA